MKTLRVVLVLCVVAMVVAVVGCGKAKEVTQAAKNAGAAAQLAQGGKATFEGENGEKVEMQVDKDAQKVTMETKEGTMTMQQEVDLEALAIEVYPGAEVLGGTKVDHPEGTAATAELHTNDDFAKVAKFYKDKYPDGHSMEQSGGEGKVLSLTASGPPDMKIIMVSEDKEKGGVKVLLQHMTETEKDKN